MNDILCLFLYVSVDFVIMTKGHRDDVCVYAPPEISSEREEIDEDWYVPKPGSRYSVDDCHRGAELIAMIMREKNANLDDKINAKLEYYRNNQYHANMTWDLCKIEPNEKYYMEILQWMKNEPKGWYIPTFAVVIYVDANFKKIDGKPILYLGF